METCTHFKLVNHTTKSMEINQSRIANVSVRLIASCDLNSEARPTLGQKKLTCEGDLTKCIFVNVDQS
jgi:hypothetical protein